MLLVVGKGRYFPHKKTYNIRKLTDKSRKLTDKIRTGELSEEKIANRYRRDDTRQVGKQAAGDGMARLGDTH